MGGRNFIVSSVNIGPKNHLSSYSNNYNSESEAMRISTLCKRSIIELKDVEAARRPSGKGMGEGIGVRTERCQTPIGGDEGRKRIAARIWAHEKAWWMNCAC